MKDRVQRVHMLGGDGLAVPPLGGQQQGDFDELSGAVGMSGVGAW